MKKNPMQECYEIRFFFIAHAASIKKELCSWSINAKPKSGILYKLVCPEASTKPHVHQEFQILRTNITSTMAYPNFQKA
jgi:hypothetical protein